MTTSVPWDCQDAFALSTAAKVGSTAQKDPYNLLNVFNMLWGEHANCVGEGVLRCAPEIDGSTFKWCMLWLKWQWVLQPSGCFANVPRHIAVDCFVMIVPG